MTSALVRGVLKRDGSRLVCEVTELKPVAGDLERLERGLSSLARQGFRNAEGVGAMGGAAGQGLQGRGAHEAGPRAGWRGLADRSRHEAAGGRRTAGVAGDGEGGPPPPGARARAGGAGPPGAAGQARGGDQRCRPAGRDPGDRDVLPECLDRSGSGRVEPGAVGGPL